VSCIKVNSILVYRKQSSSQKVPQPGSHRSRRLLVDESLRKLPPLRLRRIHEEVKIEHLLRVAD
jgi:hypothetical protein